MILATTFAQFYDMWKSLISIPGAKTALVIFLLSAVEISPIKFNPWSWIGGLIGKFLGIRALGDKVDAIDKKVDDNQATTIRVRILRFEDDLQAGRKMSKDSWDQCMDDINRYETYTETHPEFKNNITVATIHHIKHKYGDLLEKRAWTTNLTSNNR